MRLADRLPPRLRAGEAIRLGPDDPTVYRVTRVTACGAYLEPWRRRTREVTVPVRVKDTSGRLRTQLDADGNPVVRTFEATVATSIPPISAHAFVYRVTEPLTDD